MKLKAIFILFITFLCSGLSLIAQVPENKWIGDTLGPWSLISFEEPSGFIRNTPSSQNLWQIGAPQKSFFNQAYTLPNAMVTDSVNFYPANNHSSFDLFIGYFNNPIYPYDFFIDFRQKFDTDTLRDGGYITVSWDHGQSWMNILDDTISKQFFWFSPAENWGMWGNTNLYTYGDTLFNGEHGYSGKSDGWMHSCMAWYNLPVKKPHDFPPDTMILRFNFISDSIDHNKEGWMIDQIRIFSIDLGSGIGENIIETPRIRVTPNPFKTCTMVTFNKVYEQVKYQLIDPAGRIQQSGNPGRCSKFEIRRANLSPGIYLLMINDGTGQIFSASRIVLL
jgi:hypothetical protein